MGSSRKILSLAGAAIMVASAATAADMPAPVIEHIPQVPVATGGWYLRGDIGYKIYQDPKISYGSLDFERESLDDTGVVGVGVGYRFNDHFRTDLTLDYEWPAKIRGYAPCFAPCGFEYSTETAKIDVWTVLLNGYIDIGTWNGFTPYVGAGIGGSYVNVRDVRFVNPDGSSGSYPGDGKWNFSWALMAGASYAFTPNLAIDAGYRYLSIGEGQTKTFTTGGQTARIKYEDLAAHEFRVGVRYTFNSAAPVYADAPIYVPQEPIITKY